MTSSNKLITLLNWVLYSLCGLITAFLFSWIILAQFNFGYSWLHDTLHIQQHADKYGPQNRYRKNFQFTNSQEKIRLFAAINTSIHNHGAGLSAIKYKHPNGKELGTLLHHAEIIHLKDVANLLDVLKVLGALACISWIAFVILFLLKKIPRPNFKQQLLGITAFVGTASILVLLIGPVTVFYAFHEWIFPENHQWFFYYQESLMTILMKAPDLFGVIAIILTVLAMVIFITMNITTHQTLNYFTKAPKPSINKKHSKIKTL